MSEKFRVQELDGYTDGRESWIRVCDKWTREAAELAVSDLQKVYPKRKYRIRKVSRRG